MNRELLRRSLASKAVALAVLGWATIGAGVVSAQAVDCAQPANEAQKIICGDPKLKALDAKMGTLYAEAFKGASSSGKNEIAAEQRRWIMSRDGCSKDKDVTRCITAAYTARNQLLSAYSLQSRQAGRRRAGHVHVRRQEHALDRLHQRRHATGPHQAGRAVLDAAAGQERQRCAIREGQRVGLEQGQRGHVPTGEQEDGVHGATHSQRPCRRTCDR